jgi:DNA-binding transcriptional LysR family regulator
MRDFDLCDLDAFIAVARTRNFRRAALENRVSASSLSQRLSDMEERLGVRLTNRTTRSVALTEAGELLLARVAPALSEVGAALDQVRGLRDVPSGRLRINAPPPAVDLVLAPMIGPFLHACPHVELDIVAESSFIDIVDAGFDAGVRYGEHLAQDMIAVSLGPPQRYAVVASAQHVAQHGRPEHPKDLLDRCCIRTRFGSGVMLDWEFEKAGSAAGETDRNLSGARAEGGRRRRGLLADVRRLCARSRQIRRAGQRARGLVRAVSRTVSVLPKPAPAAAGARSLCGLCRGMAKAGTAKGRCSITCCPSAQMGWMNGFAAPACPPCANCPSCQCAADCSSRPTPQITTIISRVPPPIKRGVSRSSRTLVRDAMDATCRQDERRYGVRRSRVVLAPRRWRQACR